MPRRAMAWAMFLPRPRLPPVTSTIAIRWFLVGNVVGKTLVRCEGIFAVGDRLLLARSETAFYCRGRRQHCVAAGGSVVLSRSETAFYGVPILRRAS